jgi:hypothetical protein
MRRSKCTAIVAVAAAGWVTAASPGVSEAQIPDTYTNLEILPKDIKKPELMAVMRGFASSLGVRCNHCHVGENASTLEGFDFASDAKEPKKIARVMMEIVREINGDLLPKAKIQNAAEVRCITCHRGVRRPETLEDALKVTIAKEGVLAAQRQYHDLRERYYGSGAYDFRPGAVNMVAEWLAFERKDYDGAIAMMDLNLDFYPKVAYAHNLLGRIHEAKGDRAAAIASWKRALELDPKDSWSKELLQKAEGKK